LPSRKLASRKKESLSTLIPREREDKAGKNKEERRKEKHHNTRAHQKKDKKDTARLKEKSFDGKRSFWSTGPFVSPLSALFKIVVFDLATVEDAEMIQPCHYLACDGFMP